MKIPRINPIVLDLAAYKYGPGITSLYSQAASYPYRSLSMLNTPKTTKYLYI